MGSPQHGLLDLPDPAAHWCRNPELATLCTAPSRVLHPSWRAVMFPSALGDDVWTCRRAQGHLSRYLATKLEFPELSGSDPSHLAWRIAALGQAELENLVRHAGAVALGPAIRSIIDRNAIRTLMDRIGQNTYLFVVERGVLIWNPTSNGFSPHHSANDWISQGDMLVDTAGRRLVRYCLDACETGLWPRVRLKLPYCTEEMPLDSSAFPMERAAMRVVEMVGREILS